MKKIFIAPRFLSLGGTWRVFMTNSLGLFLQRNHCLPMTSFYSTDICTREEATRCVENLMNTLGGVDGIILQGGNDIDPSFYAEERGEETKTIQLFRDHFEFALVSYARAQGIPVFGICRGFQMINIVYGGTLHQHLHEQEWEVHMEAQRDIIDEMDMEHILHASHHVWLKKGGELASTYEGSTLEVNSYHHQGIKELGRELMVEAVSGDGLVEAFSSRKHGVLGVQWHPELDFHKEDIQLPLHLWLTWL